MKAEDIHKRLVDGSNVVKFDTTDKEWFWEMDAALSAIIEILLVNCDLKPPTYMGKPESFPIIFEKMLDDEYHFPTTKNIAVQHAKIFLKILKEARRGISTANLVRLFNVQWKVWNGIGVFYSKDTRKYLNKIGSYRVVRRDKKDHFVFTEKFCKKRKGWEDEKEHSLAAIIRNQFNIEKKPEKLPSVPTFVRNLKALKSEQ